MLSKTHVHQNGKNCKIGQIAESQFSNSSPSFRSLLLLFSLDKRISKTGQGTGVKLYIMIGIHDRSSKSILIFLVNNKKQQ